VVARHELRTRALVRPAFLLAAAGGAGAARCTRSSRWRKGPHANYLHATDERSPEWGGCGAHVSPQTVAALSFVVNVRDRTGSAGTVAPAHVKLVTEQAQPMSFAGFWG